MKIIEENKLAREQIKHLHPGELFQLHSDGSYYLRVCTHVGLKYINAVRIQDGDLTQFTPSQIVVPVSGEVHIK